MPVNNNKDLELPSGWVRVPLGEICETTSGGTPSRGRYDYYNGSIPWVKSGELNYNVIKNTEEKISEKGLQNSSAKLLPRGTLLIALYGATVGRLGVLGVEAATNQAVCAILTPKGLNSRYLYHFLFFSKENLLQQRTGGAQPNISQTIVNSLQVPLPPFAEQNRIVARLETLLEELEQMEVALQQAKIQAGEYRKAVLRDAFEGDIIYDVANGFEYYQLGDICELISGQHILNEDYNSSGKGTPYFTGPADFTETYPMVSKWTNKPKVISKKFDVLITVKGSGVGKSNLNNEKQAAIGRQLMAVRSEFYDPWFLFHFFKYKFQELQAKSTGSAIPGIDRSTLLTLKIPNISSKTQKQILSVLDEKLKSIQETEKDIDSNLRHTQSLRQSLLQDTFVGKLVPQDLNDEPATQLLERIKTEKIRMTEAQKQRDKANRDVKKAKTQEPEVPKTIIQVLVEKGGIYPAVSVWRESEHKDDIEKFYAELKDLMEKRKTVTEDPEKQNLLLVS